MKIERKPPLWLILKAGLERYLEAFWGSIFVFGITFHLFLVGTVMVDKLIHYIIPKTRNWDLILHMFFLGIPGLVFQVIQDIWCICTGRQVYHFWDNSEPTPMRICIVRHASTFHEEGECGCCSRQASIFVVCCDGVKRCPTCIHVHHNRVPH